MHELAIAESVAAIARRHARGRRVTEIELSVGHLRQVVPTALTFAFELVAQGTELEGAELSIRNVAVAGVCRDCGSTAAMPDFPLACKRCGGVDVDVTAGEELRVDSLELEEEPEDALTTNGGMSDG